MLEILCKDDLRHMCREVLGKYQPAIIFRKGERRQETHRKYTDFFMCEWDIWEYIPCDQRNKLKASAMRFFFHNSKNICKAFLLDKYNGDIEIAMEKTGDFNILEQKFLTWFSECRRKFQMKFDVAESKKQILKNGKRPNSHGGVANLLKVLTKTMEKQGADIRSIAKMQYTVCMQAGIYIPDEFIEDVAVALSIGERGEAENE